MNKRDKVNSHCRESQAQIAELLYRLTDKSCEMECSRYDSLMRQSGYLLTGISVISIALLTAVALIANAKVESYYPILCYVLTVLSIICQIIALAFALCSQFRYRYKQLNAPEKLREYCDDLYNQTTKAARRDAIYNSARNYADSLQEYYISIKQRNDLIRTLNKGASIALMVSLSLAFLDVLVFVTTFKVIL